MIILAIESSSLVASIAVIKDDVMLAEYTINNKKTHSQTLLPMIEEVFRMLDMQIDVIDAIAISKGPGSFTGLRIGSATAKGLSMSINKPIISISTIEAMAYTNWNSSVLVCPIMDARREQVYTGIYSFSQDYYANELLKPSAISINELIEHIKTLNKKVVFCGDGIVQYKELLINELKDLANFAPVHMNRQSAGAVGELAKRYFKEGNFQTAIEHAPEYLRESQAERELKNKNNNDN